MPADLTVSRLSRSSRARLGSYDTATEYGLQLQREARFCTERGTAV